MEAIKRNSLHNNVLFDLLCRNSVTLEDSAHTLREIFGEDSSEVTRKSPMLLGIPRKTMVRRLEVLASLLGDQEAHTSVVARPDLLVSHEETIKETYNKMKELCGRDNVRDDAPQATRTASAAHTLENLGPKVEVHC